MSRRVYSYSYLFSHTHTHTHTPCRPTDGSLSPRTAVAGPPTDFAIGLPFAYLACSCSLTWLTVGSLMAHCWLFLGLYWLIVHRNAQSLSTGLEMAYTGIAASVLMRTPSRLQAASQRSHCVLRLEKISQNAARNS